MTATLSPRERAIMGTFTIVTGGATGADALAEELALEWGMRVKLCLTPHHHRMSEEAYWEEVEKTRLAYEKLCIGDDVEKPETKCV